MSALSKTAAKALIDANITSNGANTNTGANANSTLKQLVDSWQDAIPQLTTAQINALTPTLNQLAYNTDTNYLMQYNGTIWATLVAMFIGTTAQINASTPKAGQLFYDTDLNTLSFGDGVTHVGVQTDDCTCVKTVKVTLSSSQILNSFTTPVELIPAPGAGKAINVLSVFLKANFGTTQFATSTTSYIYIGDFQRADIAIDFNATKQTILGMIGAPDISYNLENQNVTFQTPTTNPTAGDSSIDGYLTYQIITL